MELLVKAFSVRKKGGVKKFLGRKFYHKNEINKLIRQRTEALDQAIGDLYESEFTQMLSNAANRQAVLNREQREMYGSVLTADQQYQLDRLGVRRRSYDIAELELRLGRPDRYLHRFSRDGS